MLADVGLAVSSAHTWAAIDDLDAFDRASAAVAELGSSTIIVSAAGLASVAADRSLRDRLSRREGRHGTGWRLAIKPRPGGAVG